MLPGSFRGQRLSSVDDPGKSAGGAGVGEVEMFENFSDGPFFQDHARRVVPPSVLRWRKRSHAAVVRDDGPSRVTYLLRAFG